jgi:hypothetical protein
VTLHLSAKSSTVEVATTTTTTTTTTWKANTANKKTKVINTLNKKI